MSIANLKTLSRKKLKKNEKATLDSSLKVYLFLKSLVKYDMFAIYLNDVMSSYIYIHTHLSLFSSFSYLLS